MGFAQDSGYTPSTVEEILDLIRVDINTQFGTTYTAENFVGSNFYKYFYTLAQRAQENEIKTSEIFLKLQQYFAITNETIQRPVVTNPGIIEVLERSDYITSVKQMILADAGKINICVDADSGDHATGNFTITSYANLLSGTPDSVTVGATVFTAQSSAVIAGAGTFRASTDNATTAASLAAQINAHATAGALVFARALSAVVYLQAIDGGTGGNAIALAYTNNDANVGLTKSGTVLAGGTTNADYAAEKLAINTIIKDSTVAGAITQGTQTSTIVLTNGQSFDFKFHLPKKVYPLLKLTITTSLNNQVVISSPEVIKDLLLANIAARYRLGKNFEPQRYFSLQDAPWASDVLLQWSTDAGSTWNSTVITTAFDDLYVLLLANVTLVEV